MRKLRFFTIAMLTLCTVACAEKETKSLLPEFETFEYEHYEDGNYAVTISYERITNTEACEAFAIIDSLNYHSTFGEFALESPNLQRSADMMAKETLASMDDYIEDMECELHLYQVASLLRNNSVVCYDTVMETNFGGIYPIVSQSYECYDLASGNIYDFGYLAEGEWVEALCAALYDKMVATYEGELLLPAATLHVPSTIYLTDTGLTFLYQPYEIGSADMGSLAVELSDAEIAATGAPLVWE